MIANNFMFFKNTDEGCLMHSKSYTIEIFINDNAEEVIEELLQSLLSKYQISLVTAMTDTSFIFDHHYKCGKINLNHVGS